MPDAMRKPQPTLLNQVRQVLRLHHNSMHTEHSSVEGIVRFVRFHGLRSREDLFPTKRTIEAFLTDLAMHGHVAAATRHQAMNALVCLDTCALTHALPGHITVVRTDQQIHVPVVMTREEVAAGIWLMDGTANWSPIPSTGAVCTSWKPSGSGSRTSMCRCSH